MNLSTRDRRALAILAVAVPLFLIYYFWPESGSAPAPTAAASSSVPLAEQRLARLRELAATVPAKEDVLRKVSADLASYEKGLIQADTAAQAGAQLIQMLRRLAAADAIEIRATEIGPVTAFGDAYGSANVAVQVECRVEQLVNLLAALAAQPELVATSDLRITSSNPKEKTVGVRLSVTGLVPKKLVPQKKGAG
jgi:hypothetical protein